MIDYYQSQKQEQRRRRKLKVLAVVYFTLLAIIIGGAAYLLHSRYSKIETVTVSVNSQDSSLEASIRKVFDEYLINRSAVEKIVFGDKNIVLAALKESGLSQKLAEQLPVIKEASIHISLIEREVAINAAVRQKFGIWCFKNGSSEDIFATSTENQNQPVCFWFDREGVAFLEGPDTEGQLIYKVVDKYRKAIRLGDKVFDDGDYVRNLIDSFTFLEQSGLGYKTLYLVSPALEEIQSDPSVTPVVYFSLRNDPLYAIKAIVQEGSKILQSRYIDLRVPNRIYYR